MDYYVYEWIRLDTNEPFYIGKGHGDRWKRLDREYNPYFMNIIDKYPVAVNILHDNLDEQTAFEYEVWYIREYRDVIGYPLVNITDGGEGCTLCGSLNPFYGKCHTEETREKIRQSRLGKPLSEETKKKCIENHPWKGKKRPEHSEKMKGKMVGSNNPMYGKKGKESSVSKPVICITTNAVFYGMSEGARYYGIKDGSSIGTVCRGERRYCGKLEDGTPLVWKYLTIIPL